MMNIQEVRENPQNYVHKLSFFEFNIQDKNNHILTWKLPDNSSCSSKWGWKDKV